MRDYYQVLGVSQDSSIKKIKQSFRKKAKELHPDVNDSSRKYTGEEMRLLIKAYKILCDPVKRKEYDKILSHLRPSGFKYRDFLKNKKNDLRCQSKLIFFDLLHDQPDEAIELYELLNLKTTYNLENYLEYGDYLECLFLLAEELEKRGEYNKAFKFLKKIYIYEQERPFFRNYIVEIVDRLMGLVCSKIMRRNTPYRTIEYIEDLLAFNFSPKDNALLYKKLAEVYLSLGEKELAINSLEKGLQFHKRMTGVKKLKEKIGYS